MLAWAIQTGSKARRHSRVGGKKVALTHPEDGYGIHNEPKGFYGENWRVEKLAWAIQKI